MKKKTQDFLILLAVTVLLTGIPIALIFLGVINLYTAQILALGAVNAIMAISVNLISGITGQLSLGQAGFMAIGAYSCVFFTETAGLPLAVSIIAAGLFTAFIGFLIGFPTLKLSGDYLAIITLGFGEIIRVIFVNLKSITGGPNGKAFTTPISLNPMLAFTVIVLTLAVIIIITQNFLRSTYGRAILAVRDDEIAAAANGVGVFRYKMIGFIIASFIAGIGGCAYLLLIGFIKPDMGSFLRSIDYLIYVVLGGMGSMTGSIAAAFVLTYLQEFLRFLQDYRLIIYPVILILVMIFRPQGLIGMKECSFTGIFYRIANKASFAKKPRTESAGNE